MGPGMRLGTRPEMSSGSRPGRQLEGVAFVGSDVIALVAPDLVLRVVLGGVMHMTLVVEIDRMDGNDGPGNSTRLRIPAHVIADLQLLDHGAHSAMRC